MQFKAWKSRSVPPGIFLHNRCSEIAFFAKFDLLADRLNNLKNSEDSLHSSLLTLLLSIIIWSLASYFLLHTERVLDVLDISINLGNIGCI